MIKTTDEMERAFEDAADPCCHCGDTRAGLAAVLVIVERDYLLYRRLSDIEAERAGELYLAGASLKDLREHYGCSNTGVISGLRRAGVALRPIGRPRKSQP